MSQVDPMSSVFAAVGTNQELLDAIQEVAGKESRMANQMAERVVETLRKLARGEEVSAKKLAEAVQLLEFVSLGTLNYVERLQGKIIQ